MWAKKMDDLVESVKLNGIAHRKHWLSSADERKTEQIIKSINTYVCFFLNQNKLEVSGRKCYKNMLPENTILKQCIHLALSNQLKKLI